MEPIKVAVEGTIQCVPEQGVVFIPEHIPNDLLGCVFGEEDEFLKHAQGLLLVGWSEHREV